jgi:hypothetical protein
MIAWLDGESPGESDMERLLDVMTGAGACALNIVPDRNWNVKDRAVRDRKTAKLHEVVEAAEKRGLPINIGTEMNRAGLPFADDLDGEALRGFRDVFMRGARVLVGHAILSRYAGVSYASAEPMVRNGFFASVGGLPPLTRPMADRLREAGEERAYAIINDSAAAGRWIP